MIIRKAAQMDVPHIVALAKVFTRETVYDIEHDDENAVKYLMLHIMYPDMEILIAKGDDKVLGLTMLATSWETMKRPFGYFTKFYVIPEARDGQLGQQLLTASLKWFAEQEVSHVFLSATSGLDERSQRAFTLRMKRAGFAEEGPIMSLIMEGYHA